MILGDVSANGDRLGKMTRTINRRCVCPVGNEVSLEQE